ncbi:ELWxxDGT repeat protein [Lacipirellula parvula]|uniref:Uncharacterized protein n=1 Tax=Lacipirellula parvula TaxID=2650471 RepID=A0A5K7XLF6_9BACT|nr:ELWxxDGT repeat protein [Lacipirellula parvula]BBO35466.1 hypothetical protein PLANPX_5078 [Lacipirellula parvula]
MGRAMNGFGNSSSSPSCRQANGNRRLRVEQLEQRQLLSISPSMVVDANDAPNYLSLSKHELTAVGDDVFYVGRPDLQTTGLWRVNDSTGETVLVKDFPPVGQLPELPRYLAGVGGKLFFWTNSGEVYRLWTSDGTEEGTQPLRTFNLSISYGGLGIFANWEEMNGDYYFSADGGEDGFELWKSDGTLSGTVQVADVNAGVADSSPTTFANVNGLLYFGATSGTAASELWRSDGTEAGTLRVAILPGNYSYLGEPTAVGDRLFFRYYDGTNEQELWTSDGTAAGTKIARDLFTPSTGSGRVEQLTNLNGVLYFRANSGANQGMWRSDGTESGTQRINLPGLGNHPTQLANANGTLYFVSGGTVRTYDPVTNSSTLLAESLNAPSFLASAGDVLYFRANDYYPATGYHPVIYKTDGTPQGTAKIKEFPKSELYLQPSAVAAVGESLYFTALDPTSGEQQLWRTEPGVGANVEILGSHDARTLGGEPVGFTVVGDWMYYISRSSTHWTSLWRTDGVNAELIKNLRPAASGDYRRRETELINVAGTLYFTATDGEHGYELWKSDGTTAGTLMVKDILVSDQSLKAAYPQMLTNVEGALYFTASDTTWNSPVLWKSDGTAAGTAPLAGHVSYPKRLVSFKGELYYTAGSGTVIGKTDGTAAGTVQVSPAGTFFQFDPSSRLIVSGDALYFLANDGVSGTELWKSDGTTAGTHLIRQSAPGIGAMPIDSLFGAYGKLYFAESGWLWSTDGTAGGTTKILSLDAASGFDGKFAAHDDYVYFTSEEYSPPTRTPIVWKTDGTAAGTAVVARLAATPVNEYSERRFTAVDDRLYLVSIWSDQLKAAWEIGETSATSLGALPLQLKVDYFWPAIAFNSDIYFSGNDGVHGAELWRLFGPKKLAGDYNDDGRVDGADFLAWQRGYGSAATPAGSGADGDDDGTVGAGDLKVWKGNYGANTAVTSAAMATSDAPAIAAAALVASEEFEEGAFDGDALPTTVRDRIFAAGDFSLLYTTDSEQDFVRERWRRRR